MTPLVIAFTPNYFVPAAVTLRSIAQSSASSTRYEIICLVTEDIPERQKRLLERMFGDKMDFSYVNLSGRLHGAYVDPRYSEAASYRLLLPEILPEYDVVAYIDCDVIVRNDISELYHRTNLKNFLLAAVFEAPIESQAERWAAIGCDPGRYFNSGFLIMNLRKMREEKVTEQFMKALSVDYLEFPDQDVLNQVCRGRVFPLPPIYNGIRTFFLPQYKNEFLKHYLPQDWDEVQMHGTIHYTGGKPWNVFTVKFLDWWRCYDSLLAEVKSEWEINRKMLTLYRVYRTWLGQVMIDAARDLYRKIRY